MSLDHERRREVAPNHQSADQDAELTGRGPGKVARTSHLAARGPSANPVQLAPAPATIQRAPRDPDGNNAMLGAALGTELAPVQLEADAGAVTPAAPEAETAPAPGQPEEPALPRRITRANAAEVFATIAAMDASQQSRAARELGATRRSQLARSLQRDQVTAAPCQATLRVLFDRTPASEIATLIKWFELRFGLETGPADDDGIQWDKRGLRRSWDVLQALPPDHVENNPGMLRYTRYRAGSIEGYATEDDGNAAIGYGRQNSIDTEVEDGAYTDDNDPMRGSNIFDATVRHEVGHLIDASVSGSDGYCRTAAGGSWQTWGDGSGMAEVMVRQSGAAISGWSPPAEKRAIIDTLQGVIDDRAPEELDDRLAALSFVADAPDKLQAIMADPVVAAVRVSFSDQAPWDLPDGGVALSGRIYQEAYEEADWVSYAQEARDRKVSRYQFRAHWEWFAEAYAAYYQPPGEKGALLAGHDDATKAWFDAHVDPQRGAGSTVPPEQADRGQPADAREAPQAPAQANRGNGG